jgi:hypothetical protein
VVAMTETINMEDGVHGIRARRFDSLISLS